ncbi:MAG: MCP methyltransferase, CheR-type [uncultured bacterium]|nr:MAG: MCP methyltransferase, CheR-type [uncultured bacterium]
MLIISVLVYRVNCACRARMALPMTRTDAKLYTDRHTIAQYPLRGQNIKAARKLYLSERFIMQETNSSLMAILGHLLEKRGFNFSGYRLSMLERRIGKRLTATHSKDQQSYLLHLQNNPEELDMLLDAITINVSNFFRDPLTFELLADRILPAIVENKVRLNDNTIRVWSAGCAMGEEPYSVAIIIHELLQKERIRISPQIFATDIDGKALKEAEKAAYKASSLENVKHRHLTRYFSQSGKAFQLLPEITGMVTFEQYDMLATRHRVPPVSIFGNFDLILCRNLLIYLNTDCQKTVFTKLHHALARNGILILGQAEAPGLNHQQCFSRIVDFSPIYRKCQEKTANEA